MALDRTRAAAIALAEQEVARRAQILRNEVVEQLSQPGSGRTYATGNRTSPHDSHTASAPGDPPAVNTGRLRQSITALQISPGRWRVGTNVEYAIFLEWGTRKMAPRPFMRPAVEKSRGK